MRQNGKNNRQRNRGRRNGNGQINRNTTLDSNGPDVRLRGNAQQLHEKYVTLANDASAAGERIQAEAYYQYADHYFRVHSAILMASEERREKHHEQNQPEQTENNASNQTKAEKTAGRGEQTAQAEQTGQAEQMAMDVTKSDETSEASAGENADDEEQVTLQ